MKSVSIIDYGMSNLLSICRAFEFVGARVKVIEKESDILRADYLVLPGVGAFPDGMNELLKRNLIAPILKYTQSERPLMGVCLGMQMLLSNGFEHRETKGLGIIEGEVLPLPKDIKNYKVPNINWHSIEEPEKGRWVDGILSSTPPDTCFYFVHSYYANPAIGDEILAYSYFGTLKFAAAVRKNNICGTQFHPEKSGEEGLRLLKNFIKN